MKGSYMHLLLAIIGVVVIVFVMFAYWELYAPEISKGASEGLQGLLGGWS